MTARQASAAVGWFLLASPVLAFPAMLGPGHQWIAAGVAVVTMLGAVGFVMHHGPLPRFVLLLVGTSIVGWMAAHDQPETINHFCGLALGLFTMATIAVWCRTRERLTLVTLGFLLCGAVALSVGSRSVTRVHTSKALFKETTAVMSTATPLPLAALHSRTSVNPNALAATAMMILTVAMAVALSPLRWPGLQTAIRFSGLLTAVWAVVVVAVMQSRSAWLSALVVLWVWARAAVRPRLWWLITGLMMIALPLTLFVVLPEHPRVIDLMQAVKERIGIWTQGLEALRPSPWFGIGFDYYRHSGYSPILVFPSTIVGQPHAHNIFLQTALDVGVIGLVAYLGIMGYVALRAIQAVKSKPGDPWVRHIAAGAALSLLSVHVYGLLDAVPLGAKVGIFQWASCGLILASWRVLGAPGSSGMSRD
ncbi:MAG TPA: O-antigen ligase family protein [Vicinamibacterales bacterium]|nr:O-antigen ligase family protein [Vicinamibacterales bacterium]